MSWYPEFHAQLTPLIPSTHCCLFVSWDTLVTHTFTVDTITCELISWITCTAYTIAILCTLLLVRFVCLWADTNISHIPSQLTPSLVSLFSEFHAQLTPLLSSTHCCLLGLFVCELTLTVIAHTITVYAITGEMISWITFTTHIIAIIYTLLFVGFVNLWAGTHIAHIPSQLMPTLVSWYPELHAQLTPLLSFTCCLKVFFFVSWHPLVTHTFTVDTITCELISGITCTAHTIAILYTLLSVRFLFVCELTPTCHTYLHS